MNRSLLFTNIHTPIGSVSLLVLTDWSQRPETTRETGEESTVPAAVVDLSFATGEGEVVKGASAVYQPVRQRTSRHMLAVLVVSALFYALSLYSYAVFHTVVEFYSAVVAGTLFALTWNSRHLLEHDYMTALGLGMLTFAVLEIPHILAFSGLQAFPGFDVSLPSEIHLIERLLLALTFLAAPFFVSRKLHPWAGLGSVAAAVGLTLAITMWWRIVPATFVAGEGITAFKLYSEYLVIGMFVIAALFIWSKRERLDTVATWLVFGSLGSFIISEVMFTLYAAPDSIENFFGHLAQVLAFTLLYSGVVRRTLVQPYELMYRELAQSEERFRTVADTLQTGILQVPNEVPGVEIAHRYYAASDTARVGGDFYDVFELQGGRVAVVLGDVSGHGLEAATITAQVKSMLRAMAELDPSPSFVLHAVNEVLVKDLAEGRFVTVILAVICTHTRHAFVVSAGHPDPVECSDGECLIKAMPRNPPLGTIPWDHFECVEEQLAKGSTFVLYSDGITEARRGQQFFEEDGIITALRGKGDGRPSAVVDQLISQVRAFTGGSFDDDVAVLAFALRD